MFLKGRAIVHENLKRLVVKKKKINASDGDDYFKAQIR